MRFMIVIKLFSFELTYAQLIRMGRLIADDLEMNYFPLPLAADELRGRQIEIILTPKNVPLSP